MDVHHKRGQNVGTGSCEEIGLYRSVERTPHSVWLQSGGSLDWTLAELVLSVLRVPLSLRRMLNDLARL